MAVPRTHQLFSRFLVFTLILSLCIPLPLAGSANARVSGNDPGQDHGKARVWHRLNSPERKAAIEKARRLDAAMREDFARNEAAGNAAPAQTSAQVVPAKAGTQSSSVAAQGEQKALDPRLRGGDGRETRPRTMTQVMFNGVTGFMGMPGLASQHDPYAPYDPNVDQGLGFHADGTARRADGRTAPQAATPPAVILTANALPGTPEAALVTIMRVKGHHGPCRVQGQRPCPPEA